MLKLNVRASVCFAFILLAFSLLTPAPMSGCTIVSAIAADGQVWTCNNEDGPVGVANFINVFPRSKDTKYGYFTLSYFSPKFGEGGNIQGGMNEGGLTFDFNSITWVKNFDPKTKKAFPQGDDQILPHILGTMNSVEEVIDFFKTYWFQDGFRNAQMHVADRQGRFAIISASGIQLAEKGQSLVSTNFDICGKEDGSTCWRYPIAVADLKKYGASLSTMKTICQQTAQGVNTLYSNIQNLTTGDIWFSSNHDPETPVKTNIAAMLAKGRKSYTFSDLRSLIEDRPVLRAPQPIRVDLADSIKIKYAGSYSNEFTGKIVVGTDKEGIKITYDDGSAMVFQPQSENVFFLPGEDSRIAFNLDKKTNQWMMSLYQNTFWTYDVWRSEPK